MPSPPVFRTTANLVVAPLHFERDAEFLYRLKGAADQIVVTPLLITKYRAATETDVTT